MHVNQLTGDIWVADAGSNAVFRYPQFNVLAATPNYAPNATLSAVSPRALAEDAWGNIFIAVFESTGTVLESWLLSSESVDTHRTPPDLPEESDEENHYAQICH